MRRWVSVVVGVVFVLAAGSPAMAQIPPEWPAAARAVLGELEKGSPMADRPFKDESRLGWRLARKWRLHNNRNVAIELGEYLAMVTLCRWSGCARDAVAGRTIAQRADQVKAEKKKHADDYATVDASLAWLNGLEGPGTEPARKNAALWGQDKNPAAADFAMSNLYVLGWILAREQPDPARQAAMMGIFGLYVYGKGWYGEQCLDITKVAAVLDAPPTVGRCN
jgi:hypothetical protein